MDKLKELLEAIKESKNFTAEYTILIMFNELCQDRDRAEFAITLLDFIESVEKSDGITKIKDTDGIPF